MSDALYVTSMQPRSGKAVVALGLMEMLVGQVDRIAVFRPVIADGAGPDPLIELLLERYQLEIGYEDTYAFTYSDAARVEHEGGTSRLIAQVLDRFSRLRDKFEFVLCIGTDYTGPTAATELALNAEFAVNLGTPVLNVVSGFGKDAESLAIASRNSQQLLLDHGCALVATVLNRVDACGCRRRSRGPCCAAGTGLPAARRAGARGADGR